MESTHDSSCRTVQTLRDTAHRPTAAFRHPAPHRQCSRPSKTLLLTTASCPRPSMERKDSKDVHVWPLVYQAENVNARRERNVAWRRILPIPVEGSEVAESSRFEWEVILCRRLCRRRRLRGASWGARSVAAFPWEDARICAGEVEYQREY
jgi:hypothetical protein